MVVISYLMAVTPHQIPAKTWPPPASNPPLVTTPLDPKTLLLHKCRTVNDVRQVHGHAVKTGLIRDLSMVENLLECTALIVPNSLHYALEVFEEMPFRNAASYNIVIRGFILNRLFDRALGLFCRMLDEDVRPDKYTFSCVLKACSRARAVSEGEQVHALVAKSNCVSQGFVENTLIHMYASCGFSIVARKVFDGMPNKDCVAWNAMFAGYSRSGDWGEVVSLFREMVDLSVRFDEVALISVLTACGRVGDLELGEWIDRHMEENGFENNLNLVTALVDMYAKCGEIDHARELFDQMPHRDVVAWSAMISGYSQASRSKEALEVFHMMQLADVKPNEVTMVSVLASCAVLGAYETGRWVHSFIKKKKLPLTVNLGTALVDFYAKCGAIDSAVGVFNIMPRKNAWSWTVLIQGLASNGKGGEALVLFDSMLKANVQPNDVTFIAVLSACSHTGLVEEGRSFFDSMSRNYGIVPRIDHYGCMVDVFARAGLLDKAYHFIRTMPIKPNAVIWRTLLASCKVHKNVELGEVALSQIIILEPRHSGDYILLSNIYASVGRMDDAVRVRANMKEKGIKKTPGCTLIELEGTIHEFFAEDCDHPHCKEIYEKLEQVISQIKLVGYVPKTEEARLDAEEDEKETSVSHHSEKLAIAFGLIKSAPGAAIRISKNLRVCTDCHYATKLISKVFQREIIVRDRNRFHHFRDGVCSCNDYW